MSGGHRHPNYQQPQAGYPPQPPLYGYPHPEAVFVNQAPRDTSVTRMTIPIVMAATVAVALVAGTYGATVQFTEIRNAIQSLSEKMDRMSMDLSGRIERVERDGWTKTDHQLWCSRAERVNAGWRCSEGALPFRPDQPATRADSWRPVK